MNQNITPNMGAHALPHTSPSGRFLKIAITLANIGEYEDAEYLLEIVLLLEPENIKARKTLAEILEKQGTQEALNRAEKILKEAENINNDPGIHTILSGIYHSKGDGEKAYQEFVTAINMRKVMSE